MARHRVRSIGFERQVVAEHAAAETLCGLARRHDSCRNPIRVRAARAEAGEFDEAVEASNLLPACAGEIAVLERLVGRQALELEFPKRASKQARSSRSASTSVITGPLAPALPKAAG
jgi:transposase